MVLKAAEEGAKNRPDMWYSQQARMGILYRLKCYEEALELVPQCEPLVKNSMQGVNLKLWQAMTLHQLGQKQPAKKLLSEAIEVIETQLAGPMDFLNQPHADQFTYQLLRKEAEELILRANNNQPKTLQPERPKLTPSKLFQRDLNHPDGPGGQLALADVHILCGFHEEAKQCLKNALEGIEQLSVKHSKYASSLRSYRGKAFSTLGTMHLRLKEYSEAEKTYRDALSISPSSTYRLGLAKALTAQGKTNEADAEFDQVFRVYSRSASSLNKLAWPLVIDPDPKLQNGQAAVKMSQKAVELSPDNGSYWNTLGVAHYRNGQWREAVTALKKSMSLRSGGDAHEWFFLAMAYQKLEKPNKAKNWFDKSVQWLEENKPGDAELVRIQEEAQTTVFPKAKPAIAEKPQPS